MTNKKLTRNILIGMALGIIVGLIFHPFADGYWVKTYISGGVLHLGGQIFLTLMKMLVVPLVFVSIVCGASNVADPKSLGRIGGKTIILYVCTTAIAITLAIVVSLLFQVGKGANISTENLSFHAAPAQSFLETILSLFTANPINSLAEGHLLQIIIFALLFGIAINFAKEAGTRIKNWFDDINEVIMSLVSIIIALTPYGVFALIAKLVITTDLNKFVYVLGYFFTVLIVLFIHLFITNGILVGILARLNPITFFKKMLRVQLFAFSTASSNATLPVTLETAEKEIGINNKVASFTIPLGATINMDGTAIMQGVATVFIAHIYNIDLSLGAYLMVILTATLSSIGTAGVPGIGLITLTLVLTQVGLPIEGIALIIGIDRILDMVRTAVNVTGDVSVTAVVANSEKQIDRDIYYQ
ncbi:dicarboxylate/amino acid:cation symporter [Cysteiniphilum sp. QT6929]|uniref:dicarboxylate/amino acid:cation symporter n=1 Tax=Cysteiniphilum sp. QT6929 TaxID=2975055 RepID=UPI0024B32176|nr:dicarboxylate/amino acid:cation symporter [Cysteiniphilum sp. QT6929]WHN64695.1 dicarboxylate/amino acid:cation symporter [Cysteiniphilum sp. QT6929]